MVYAFIFASFQKLLERFFSIIGTQILPLKQTLNEDLIVLEVRKTH